MTILLDQFFRICTRRTAGSYDNSIFSLKLILFTIAATPQRDSHQQCAEAFQFLPQLVITYLCLFLLWFLLYNNLQTSVRRYSNVDFCLAFPHDSWCWVSLHISVGQFYIFFGKNVYSFAHFLFSLFSRLFVLFVAIELWKFFCIFGCINFSSDILSCSLVCLFILLIVSFCYAEAFWFDIVSYYFCFYYFDFGCHIQEIF